MFTAPSSTPRISSTEDGTWKHLWSRHGLDAFRNVIWISLRCIWRTLYTENKVHDIYKMLWIFRALIVIVVLVLSFEIGDQLDMHWDVFCILTLPIMCIRIASSEPLINVCQQNWFPGTGWLCVHLMWAKKDVAAWLTLFSKSTAPWQEGTNNKIRIHKA